MENINATFLIIIRLKYQMYLVISKMKYQSHRASIANSHICAQLSNN